MKKLFDPVKGKTIPVFFYYSVPSVLSMLALSCAVIIDGFFIGKYCGSDALAAVNLTVPVSALLIGIALMLSVGGAASCGRHLGKLDFEYGGTIFSQTVVLILVVSLSASAFGMIFIDRLVELLGANGVIHGQTADYLRIMLAFNVFQMGIVCFSFFLRVDGSPLFASFVMVAGSLLNIVLDWVFVVKMGMGIKGAALGTGVSEMVTAVILALPFILNQTRLKFKWESSDLSEALKGACNGFSEFTNEVSAGIITLVFNWIIMHRLGETGVAAFSVVNYIIICGLAVNCGISDSIQPMVSENYGAEKPGRIRSFLGIAMTAVFAMGIAISCVLVFIPGAVTDIFIKSGDLETILMTNTFISRMWPAFLLNGVNVVLSSYLTAMNRAFHSTVVSLARNLFLPVAFLLTLPLLTGDEGLFIVLPLSELVTFFIAIYLLNRNSPAKLIGQNRIFNMAFAK